MDIGVYTVVSLLIRTPLLPSNSVLFREVSFGETEHYTYS